MQLNGLSTRWHLSTLTDRADVTKPTPTLRSLCAFILLAVSSQAFAHDSDLPAQCHALEGVMYPAADMPGPRDMAGLLGCDPGTLYYYGDGPEQAADDKKALHCAHSLTGYRFESHGVLSMLYANGRGVARNYDYARKAVCAVSEDAAEVANLLAKVASAEEAKEPFNICVHAKGDELTAGCALVEANHRAKVRTTKLSQLASGWPADYSAAFDTLQGALAAYSDARADAETLAGPQRSARAISEIVRTDDWFLYVVGRFERGTQLTYTPGQLRADEQKLKELNAYLRRAAKARPQLGLTVERLKKSHEAWVSYREAWVKFSQVRYPKASTSTIRGNVTFWRVLELSRLVENIRAAATHK